MKANEFTLTKTIELLRTHSLSHNELYADINAAVKEKNNTLRIYLAIDQQAEQKAKAREDLPLAGVPLAIKDNFLTIELPTTAASTVLDGFMSPYESTVTKKLTEAGGVVFGKTNMDAWAHGSSTETSDFGSTKNPRNPGFLPGGSSGGSAAAVAADVCIAAIGSETAGSIRQPASWCGCVGLKPTYGRVSRAGIVSMASSMDSPGPLTKSVEDAATLFHFMSGKDPYDATTSNKEVPDVQKTLRMGIKGFNIGICYVDHEKLKGTQAADAVLKAGELFESLGATVSLIPQSEQLEKNKILTPNYAIGIYTIVQRAEVSSNLARYDGVRYGTDRSKFGAEAKRRIILGTFALSKSFDENIYDKAQRTRSLYIQNFEQLLSNYDVLISPSSPGFAQPLGASEHSPMFGELEDMLMEPTSISGLPGINVPSFHDPKTNLYLGMDIVSGQWQEDKLLRAAFAFEEHTSWNSWKKLV